MSQRRQQKRKLLASKRGCGQCRVSADLVGELLSCNCPCRDNESCRTGVRWREFVSDLIVHLHLITPPVAGFRETCVLDWSLWEVMHAHCFLLLQMPVYVWGILFLHLTPAVSFHEPHGYVRKRGWSVRENSLLSSNFALGRKDAARSFSVRLNAAWTQLGPSADGDRSGGQCGSSCAFMRRVEWELFVRCRDWGVYMHNSAHMCLFKK